MTVDRQATGRSAIDWGEASVYYLSLPDGRRTYRAVAERFGVSVRTVERHGREGCWRERVQRHKRDAARTVDEELTARQVDALENHLRRVEETMARYEEQLQAGTVRVTPSDLGRMIGLHQQLGDTIATLAQSDPLDPTIAASTEEQRLEHKLDVLRNLLRAGQLDDLLGVLDHAGTTDNDNDPNQEALR
jgi:hypothetical protein